MEKIERLIAKALILEAVIHADDAELEALVKFLFQKDVKVVGSLVELLQEDSADAVAAQPD